MREIVKKEWSALKPIWDGLIQENPIATPFQSYEFLSFTGKGKPQRKDLFRTIGLRELNLVLYIDHTPIAIAPLLYKTKKGKSTVYLRGHFTVANQLDLIYTSLSYDDFKFLMDGIRNTLGEVSFFLDRIYCQSQTSDYLKKYLPSAEISEIESFAIPIPKHYDDWYQSLRKSARQKLNNTKNRMAKDGVRCETSFYIGEKIDSAIYKDMIFVCVDRFLVKNRFRFGPLQYLVKKVLQFFLIKDKVSQWLRTTNNCFHVIVYMNGEIAAFTCGLICNNKRILLNRLAIYTKFGRYNPGGVLLSSAVGYLIEQNAAGNTDIDKLDMSQGGQGGMSYKAAYGGEVYYNYIFNE